MAAGLWVHDGRYPGSTAKRTENGSRKDRGIGRGPRTSASHPHTMQRRQRGVGLKSRRQLSNGAFWKPRSRPREPSGGQRQARVARGAQIARLACSGMSRSLRCGWCVQMRNCNSCTRRLKTDFTACHDYRLKAMTPSENLCSVAEQIHAS